MPPTAIRPIKQMKTISREPLFFFGTVTGGGTVSVGGTATVGGTAIVGGTATVGGTEGCRRWSSSRSNAFWTSAILEGVFEDLYQAYA